MANVVGEVAGLLQGSYWGLDLLAPVFLFGQENNPLAWRSHSVLGFLLIAAKYIPAC